MFFEEGTRNMLSWISGILCLLGFVPYIYAIVTDPKTDPKPSTWFVWSALDSLGLLGMRNKNTVTGQIIGAVTGAWIVFFLSLKYGKGKWNRLDSFCVGGGILGAFAWWWYGDATWAIVISMSTIVVGAAPTVKSAWLDPGHEDKWGWLLWGLSCITSLGAIPTWTWDDATQPISFTLIEVTVTSIVWIKPLFRSKNL